MATSQLLPCLRNETLKSNCRTFGASELGNVCQDIEELAAAGNIGGLASMIDHAESLYPGVVAALEAEKRGSD